MFAPNSFDYSVVRVVPHIDRGEFINAGIILFCRTQMFLDAIVDLDEKRLIALAPTIDAELVRETLSVIPRICAGAGPIGRLPQPDRFHWLVSPRSTIIQTSPVHCGLCENPAAELERLMNGLVRVEGKPKRAAPIWWVGRR